MFWVITYFLKSWFNSISDINFETGSSKTDGVWVGKNFDRELLKRFCCEFNKTAAVPPFNVVVGCGAVLLSRTIEVFENLINDSDCSISSVSGRIPEGISGSSLINST